MSGLHLLILKLVAILPDSVGVGLIGIVLPAEEGSIELVGSVLAIEGSSVGPVDEGSIVDPVEEGLEVGEPMEEVGDSIIKNNSL